MRLYARFQAIPFPDNDENNESSSSMIVLQISFLLIYAFTAQALVSRTAVPTPLQDAASVRRVPLDLAMEQQLWQRGEPPISVAVWFHGDHKQVALFLEERARQIIKLNPWLLGKVRSDLFGRPILEYIENPTIDSLSCVQHVSQDQSTISRFTPVERLYKATRSFATLKPSKGPLWRIAVVPCQKQPHEYFALIVSMSHVAGDGHVFVSLMSMLCSIEQDMVRAFDLDPVAKSDELARQALGSDAFEFQNNSLAMLSKGLVGIIRRFLFGKGQELWFLVDENAMDAIKRADVASSQSKKAVKSTTTNNVLASWFFQNSGCSVGLMCVDYRGKLKGHHHRLGRNYWGTIVYQKNDFDDTTKIYESIKSLKRTHSGALPTPLDFVTKGSIAIATSWTKHRGRWSLPGCQEEVRIPLFDFASVCPSGFVVMRAFTVKEGRTAVYVAGDAEMMDGLKAAPFRSEELLI